MSFATVPDDSRTCVYSNFAAPYMIIADTTLTCSVKKWGIVTNYAGYVINDNSYI